MGQIVKHRHFSLHTWFNETFRNATIASRVVFDKGLQRFTPLGVSDEKFTTIRASDAVMVDIPTGYD
jgi:hypothetical protein